MSNKKNQGSLILKGIIPTGDINLLRVQTLTNEHRFFVWGGGLDCLTPSG